MKVNPAESPWIARIGLALAAGFMTALWIGMLLAEAGRFSAWPAFLAAILAGGFVWRRIRPRPAAEPAREGQPRYRIAAGLLALVSLTFTLPPSEFILGGWDPGVYVHTAAGLSAQGSLRPEFPDLAAMSPEDRALVGRQGQHAWEPFPGMPMMRDGRLSPQFYHLYPVLLALAWPFGGVRAALMVNPLLNAFSLVALFLWACRWVRPRWAFGTALLLALNPAQVWQAGFPTAELLAQCLLLIGLIATDRALAGTGDRWLDPLMAGTAFGLTMLARYDAILFVVPFSLVLLTGLRDRARRRRLLILLGTTAVFGGHVWFHQVHFSPLYYPMGNWVVPGLAGAGLLAALVVTGSCLLPRRITQAWPDAPRWMTGLRVAALVAFAAWVFLFWRVRPHLAPGGGVWTLLTGLFPFLNEPGWYTLAAGRNGKNFLYLQSLFGRPGLLVALTGIGLLIVRRQAVWKTAWLAASLCVLVLLITQISHEPFMMFVSRRLVPVILPLLCLGLAVFCDRLDGLMRSWPRSGAVAASLVLALPLALTFRGTAFMATHREWPGLADWHDRLANRIPPGSVVYSDAPGFAAPLRFLRGFQAFEVRPLSPGRRTDPMAMMRERAKDKRVFWLTQIPIPKAYAGSFTPTASLSLRSSALGSSRHTVPRYIRFRGGTFTLYRIEAASGD